MSVKHLHLLTVIGTSIVTLAFTARHIGFIFIVEVGLVLSHVEMLSQVIKISGCWGFILLKYIVVYEVYIASPLKFSL